MEVNLSPRFKRAYKKLPKSAQNDFDIKIALFTGNPRNPTLKTHKLKGNLQSCLSFYLRDGYRVLFEFENTHEINLLDIGPHDKYYSWKR
ncbi:MAG: type II toxin-antitoxin system RelE/ParE family toxin [bacterium]